MLVREYLKRALYDAGQGYFVQATPIIYREGRTVNFPRLSGREEWTRTETEMYSEAETDTRGGEWLTQSELFAPYFSRTLVEFAVHQHVSKNKDTAGGDCLNVIEIGGGSGTNALHFLDGLKLRYPQIYAKTRYNLCEISPTLAKIQTSRLSGRHPGVFGVINQDFLSWSKRIEEPTMILAMEVLDNLPHDKVVYKGPERKFRDFQFTNASLWEEVLVTTAGVEVTQPLTDFYIQRALELLFRKDIERSKPNLTLMDRLRRNANEFLSQWPRFAAERGAKAIFLPTASLQFLEILRKYFPQHTLLAGDFAYLPFGDVRTTDRNLRVPGSLFKCRNAPIVSGYDVETKTRKDFATYILRKQQKCDVFFQTDFPALLHAYEAETLGKACIKTSPEFLSTHCPMEDREKTTTQSGYNPMLEDFANVSFIIGRRN